MFQEPFWRLGKATWARHWMVWAGLAVACTAFAFCNAFSWYPSRHSGANGPSWNQAIAWELLRWYLWLPIGTMIIWSERRFHGQPERTPHPIIANGASALFFSAIHSTFLVVIYFPFTSASAAAFLRYRSFVLAIDFLSGLVVSGLIIGVARARGYYFRLRDEELRASQLQAQIAEAQLEALKMQLHPHFLFNTLNAISALQFEDPERAQRALVRLADFLRLTLENAGVQEVTLDSEVDFLMRYLEIERIRFPEKLTVQMEIDPATRDAQVPNLILQPLVENAIRHGIAAKTAPGRIEISSSKNNGALLLRVRDTGPGITAPPREGIGLANTRARLDRLYGAASHLRLKNATGGGLEASIEIPLVVRRKT
jgi:two-component system, LytTR family, sensor kinase